MMNQSGKQTGMSFSGLPSRSKPSSKGNQSSPEEVEQQQNRQSQQQNVSPLNRKTDQTKQATQATPEVVNLFQQKAISTPHENKHQVSDHSFTPKYKLRRLGTTSAFKQYIKNNENSPTGHGDISAYPTVSAFNLQNHHHPAGDELYNLSAYRNPLSDLLTQPMQQLGYAN